MMNADNPELFEEFKEGFYEEWEEYSQFINYFSTVWLPKKENWSKAWRHVNNFLLLVSLLYHKFLNIIIIYLSNFRISTKTLIQITSPKAGTGFLKDSI